MVEDNFLVQILSDVNEILSKEASLKEKIIDLYEYRKKMLFYGNDVMDFLDSLINSLKSEKLEKRENIHREMFNLFKIIYIVINGNCSYEDIKIAFLDEEERNSTIKKAKNVDELRNILMSYYGYDIQVSEIIEKDFEKISKYEESYKKIKTKNFSTEDLDIYFECLKETFTSYLSKKLDDNFRFYSKEMRNSLHSLINAKGKRVEIDVNLSIPHDKVLHLMAIPSMFSENNFFSKLYLEYKKQYPQKLEYINEQIHDSSDVIEYMNFVCLVAPKYLKLIFNNEIPNNDKDKQILEKCIHDKEKIRKEISKSFEKIINFREIYEYKYIPEIVMDYEIDENTREAKYGEKYNDDNTREHRFGLNSKAITPMNNLVDFKDKFIKDDNSKCGYIIKDEKISEEDKEILYEIVKKVGTIDIKVRYKNGIIKENGRVGFKYYTPLNVITGNTGEDAQYVQYNYYPETGEFLSDLPPSIFLLSYDTNELEKEELKDKICICEAIAILGKLVANEIINSDKLYLKETKEQDGKVSYEILSSKSSQKFIFKKPTIEANKFKRVLDSIFANSKEVLSEDKGLVDALFDNVSEKINNTKINENIFAEVVYYYLYDQLYNHNKININEMSEYKKDVNDELLNRLSLHIKSFFIDDLASSHYRSEFNLSTYYESNQIPSDFDQHIPLNIVMIIAQKLRDENERKYYQMDPDRANKNIGMVGFGIMREDVPDYVISENQDTTIEKYAKTFLGKTTFQLLMDLRLNGWSYKLDSIYNDDEDFVVYNLNPISRNKKLKLELEKFIENNKKYDNEKNNDNPKRRR